KLYGLQAEIKWPNDVLINGLKLSGILIQVRNGMAVAGIGLNALSGAGDLPDGATSVRNETGEDVDLDDLLAALLASIGARYRDLQRGDIRETIERVNARLYLRDANVTLNDGDRTIQGRVIRVREDGALLLDAAGTTRAVVSGELARGP